MGQALGDLGLRVVALGGLGGEVLVTGRGAEVSDEEIGVGAVEHDHFEIGFGLGQVEQAREVRHGVVVEQDDRRMVERRTPIGSTAAVQP